MRAKSTPPLLLFSALFCLLLACTGTALIGVVADTETLAGVAYWTAATGSPVPTQTRYLGMSTPVIPATPTPYTIVETSQLPTILTTATLTPPHWSATATPTWQPTATPWWITTTPVVVYNNITTTPVPAWTTTPSLPIYALTTPVPTETPIYHIGRFFMHSDVYIGDGYAPVVRMVNYERQDHPLAETPYTWHYVTLTIRNQTDSRPVIMPLTDVFFIRRIAAADGSQIQGEWRVVNDPLLARAWPLPEETEATPLPIHSERTVTLAFETPIGDMLELGLITDWSRQIAYGLPIWFVPELNPEAPFVEADHPPPPTSVYLDDVAAYNGNQQPVATVGAGTPWPTLPAATIGRWPTNGSQTRGFACQTFFTGVDGTGWGCPDEKPWFHPGSDIANSTDNPIVAPITGHVTFAGADVWGSDCSDFAGSDYPHTGFGNYIKISGAGMLHYFAHLNSFAVGNDAPVTAGQPIAGMGSTGCSTGSHLHWQVKVNGQFIDPAIWAGAGPPP